jgi:hypothetical protein
MVNEGEGRESEVTVCWTSSLSKLLSLERQEMVCKETEIKGSKKASNLECKGC